MQKQLLIFDLDGTLIDSVPDITVAVNAMLKDINKPEFSENHIRNWVGNGSRKLVERALFYSDYPNSEADSNNPSIHTDDEINIFHEIFLQHYNHHCAIKTNPYQGVHEGLQLLKENGYRLALVTNKPMKFIPEILRTFCWHELFEVVLGGDSFDQKKPNPVQLNHVLQTLKIAPENAYMIGDSKNDIQAGENANIQTIGLTYGYNYGQSIHEFNPNQVFDNFDDMVAFLLELSNS